MINLKDITNFKYGPHLKTDTMGKVKYLLASHFDYNSNLSRFKESFIKSDEDIKEDYLLKKNDLIIAGKGQRFFAWAYDEKYGECVASSLFYVSRINQNKVLAKFLAIQLNSSPMQKRINQLLEGGTISVFPKNALMNLKIKLPTIEIQQKVVDLHERFTDEISLLEELKNKSEIRFNTILNKYLKEMS